MKLCINTRDKRLVLTEVPDSRKAEVSEFFTHDWGATFYHAPITKEVLKAAFAFGAELSPVESIKIDLYLEMNGGDEELGTDQNWDFEAGEWGETVGFIVSHPTLGFGKLIALYYHLCSSLSFGLCSIHESFFKSSLLL